MANQQQQASAIEVGGYCRGVALRAIGVTNADNKSASWSPNNVKRLYICPDGVMVEFFTGTPSKYVPFDPNKYVECISSQKYKPMIGVLAGKGNSNVCSNIEEIIVCTKSRVPQLAQRGISVHPLEVAYENIIDSAKIGGDMKQAIQARFGRLRAVMIFNMDIATLTNGVKTVRANNSGKGIQPEYMLADTKMISSRASTVVDFNTGSWFNSISLRPQFYRADAEGGVLYKKLHSIKDKYAVTKKSDEAAKARDAYIGSLREEVTKEAELLKLEANAVLTLLILQQHLGVFGEVVKYSDGVSKLTHRMSELSPMCADKEIFSDAVKARMSKLGIRFLPLKEIAPDSKDAYSKVLVTLKNGTTKFYIDLCNFFVNVLTTLNSSFPAVASIVYEHYTGKIRLVEQSAKNIESISHAYKGIVLSGVSPETSIRNMCMAITAVSIKTSKLSAEGLDSPERWDKLLGVKTSG